MGQRGPLRWRDGTGWLVLVGGEDWRSGASDAIDPHILNLANLDRPLLVLSDSHPAEELEDFVDYLIGCGASFAASYTLAARGTPPDLLEDLADAGVVYLLTRNPLRLVRSLRYSPVLEAIIQGYTSEQGLIVVGYGAAAACFGAQVWQGRQMEEGLQWLEHIVVQPGYDAQPETLRAIARSQPDLLGLGLPADTALALGPDHQVLTWGTGQITAVIHQAGTSTPEA